MSAGLVSFALCGKVAHELFAQTACQITDAGRGHLAYEGLAIAVHDEFLRKMDLLKKRGRTWKQTDIERNVRIGGNGDTAPQLRATLGDFAARVDARTVGASIKAVLVNLDQLMLFLGSEDHLVSIIGNPGSASMAQNEYLGVFQNVQIHLRGLRKRCVPRELVAMDTRHQIVEVFVVYSKRVCLPLSARPTMFSGQTMS